ncbi:MAG: NAD(P)-dependent oxidoreductase [Arachidicoccus sp.]|nr:NAD(P)-dependent oxidoreductase [Arachidicoccus sp.]
MSFTNRTVFISGGSRGIGKAIILRLVKDGANIILAAKSVEENPKLGGTIYSVAEEIEQAGAKCLPIQCDIRFEEQIKKAVEQGAQKFGGIDIVINNASAIELTNTEATTVKSFDLMFDINVRGTFFVTQACIPYLKKSANPHILTLSPPINLNQKWFAQHVAYTLAKYNMTFMTIGWATEFKSYGISSNTLWPRTTIDTAAVRNLLGGEALAQMSRIPDILAEAAYYILSKEKNIYTGQSFIDEEVLARESITDLSKYAVNPGKNLYTDLFLDESK